MNLDFTWESYGDAYRVFDGSGGVHVSGWYETRLIREVERLTRERDDEVERHASLSRAVGDAVAPLGNRYLDPPDGGSVDLPEFIARAVADLLRVERERDEARGTVRHLEAELRVAKSHAASYRGSATDERLKAERATADLASARRQRDNAESDAGKLQADVYSLRDDLAAARAERDGLAKALRRSGDLHRENDSQVRRARREGDGVGHHCRWRVVAEAMAERSRAALTEARAALAALPTPPKEEA